MLICSEVALAFLLLIGAGLMIQTFANLRAVDPGFRTSNLLTLQLIPSRTRALPQIVADQAEMLRRIRAIPGVESAGFTNHIPIAVKGDVTGVGAEGHDGAVQFQCNSRAVGPGYLSAMGIPIVRGRDIQETDVQAHRTYC